MIPAPSDSGLSLFTLSDMPSPTTPGSPTSISSSAGTSILAFIAWSSARHLPILPQIRFTRVGSVNFTGLVLVVAHTYQDIAAGRARLHGRHHRPNGQGLAALAPRRA